MGTLLVGTYLPSYLPVIGSKSPRFFLFQFKLRKVLGRLGVLFSKRKKEKKPRHILGRYYIRKPSVLV